MLQVLQHQKSGKLMIEELPLPVCTAGHVLVRTSHSVISVGTEKTSVQTAQANVFEKARLRPDLVKKVLATAKTEGILNTFKKVQTRLDTVKSLGYSSSGVVIESRCDEFAVGDRVACAGAGFASHAEIVSVPKNLSARIPEAVSLEDAAYTTLASIALQGVRQADIRLGETVAVIGLGLLGQITIQLLRASGCSVIALDINEQLFQKAKDFGADSTLLSSRESCSRIHRRTRGIGCDAVIITAGTQSNEPIELATEIARQRGRIVVVGAVGMNVPRSPFYEKELTLTIACSYGPGRYDPRYEEDGIDYPIGYVRWTEQRNMQAILDLLAQKQLDFSALTTHRFDVENALSAYDIVTGKLKEFSLGIVLNYPARTTAGQFDCKNATQKYSPSAIVLGVIGAGNFAQSYLLPHFQKQGVDFASVVTGSPVNAMAVAKKFDFRSYSTNPSTLLDDPRINLVVCASRHDSHAKYVETALQHGKAVFVEKPLAITKQQLDAIAKARAQFDGRVLVGFNRRFSKPIIEIKNFLEERIQPMSILYRVNAGAISRDHWIQQSSQGGRIIGEVCHFVDTMSFLTNALPIDVVATALGDSVSDSPNHDNVSVVIRFSDGSVGTLLYLANSAETVAKEYLEVSCEGKTAVMDNFKSVELFGDRKRRRVKFNGEKGHEEEVGAVIAVIKNGTPFPISFESLYATTLTTIRICESLQNGERVTLSEEVYTSDIVKQILNSIND